MQQTETKAAFGAGMIFGMGVIAGTILGAGVILGVAGLGILMIRKWDTPLPLRSSMYWKIGFAALWEGSMIRLLTAEKYQSLLMAVIGGSLLLACITDMLLCQVYHFTWWPALAAAAALLSYKCSRYGLWENRRILLKEILGPLVLFLFLQFLFFRRMYGRADYYAFCVCAIAETAAGVGIRGYLLHMLLAYSFLLPVQAVRRNINKKGNLKQPVPFLPYITAAFWFAVFLGKKLYFFSP